MTSPRLTKNRLIKNSIATAAVAAALLVTPFVAQAQDSAPPPPDQYGNPHPYQGQANPPDDGMQYDAAIQNSAPQPGAPQGIQQAPPAIPDYTQPPAPGDGYIWTPGYWAWTGDGYEWVQGAWVAAPYTGALWTPGYWGYGYGGYFWNTGYWGPSVGYYGGINYGFGYFGIGFYGGYWGGGRFYYNRAYCHFNNGYHYHNVYNRPYNGYSGHPGGNSYVAQLNVYHGSQPRRNAIRHELPRLQHQRPHLKLRSDQQPPCLQRRKRHHPEPLPLGLQRSRQLQRRARNFSQPAQAYSGAARGYTTPTGSTRSFPQQQPELHRRTHGLMPQPSQAYQRRARSFSQPSQPYAAAHAATPLPARATAAVA